MKKLLFLCAMISFCFISCGKKQEVSIMEQNIDEVESVKTEITNDETSVKKYRVCVFPFSNNINVEVEYTKDARTRVLSGLKSNPQNAEIEFTDCITTDCQSIVYGVITNQRTTKIDSQDVVVSYRLSVQSINPVNNFEIDSFAEYSDKSIENSARNLNVFPIKEEIISENTIDETQHEESADSQTDESQPPVESHSENKIDTENQ